MIKHTNSYRGFMVSQDVIIPFITIVNDIKVWGYFSNYIF